MLFRSYLIALLLSCFSFSTFAASYQGVGVKKIAVVDPVDQKPMDAVAFYPSNQQSAVTAIGPYDVDASKAVEVAKGRFPLVVISHGNAGSMWGHHALASFLIREGYIVAMVTHSGDNFQDLSRVGTTGAVYGRPMQISALITAALKDEDLAAHIDEKRIGFVGFSAGGTTGLILADARPDFSLLETYCSERPEDRGVCEAKGHIKDSGEKLAPKADSRVRSYVLLAPLSVPFAPDQVQEIKAPVLIFAGANDKELSTAKNAEKLATEMQANAQLNIIPNAGHFTFLSPCSARLREAAPTICVDELDVDRQVIHRDMNSEISEFFSRTLDGNDY